MLITPETEQVKIRISTLHFFRSPVPASPHLENTHHIESSQHSVSAIHLVRGKKKPVPFKLNDQRIFAVRFSDLSYI